MSLYNFTPKEFAAIGAKVWEDDCQKVAAEAVAVTIERAMPIARKLTPRGDAEGRARHKRQGFRPMITRWFAFLEWQGIARQEQDSASNLRVKFGQAAGIANDAPHATVINRGRLALSTNRMGGSEQAPRGITNPLHARISSQTDSIITEAGRRAERRMRTK